MANDKFRNLIKYLLNIAHMLNILHSEFENNISRYNLNVYETHKNVHSRGQNEISI